MQKSILITGCSSGIGLCVARGLKQRGWRVFASVRKAADMDQLRSLDIECVQLDLNDSMSIKNAVTNVLFETQGKLDALFNNGGFGLPGAIEDLSRDALRAQFETNVFGWIELTNQVLPIMRKHGHGRIIMNSSVLGFAAMPYRGAYNASKFAIEGFSDTLRQELHGSAIHVSLIEPGPILSQFRSNSVKAFNKFIDKNTSIHQPQYDAMLARLNKEGAAAPFTLGPEAVLEKVIHALESRKPKIRYYVTVPTYLFGYLKRFLPYWLMDKILRHAGGGGKR